MGTIVPKSKLDIPAANHAVPNNQDADLIPRIKGKIWWLATGDGGTGCRLDLY